VRDRQILEELYGNDLLQKKSSMSPMGRELVAFAVVEIGGSKQPVVVPASRIKTFIE
jgi:hypothetical protein